MLGQIAEHDFTLWTNIDSHQTFTHTWEKLLSSMKVPYPGYPILAKTWKAGIVVMKKSKWFTHVGLYKKQRLAGVTPRNFKKSRCKLVASGVFWCPILNDTLYRFQAKSMFWSKYQYSKRYFIYSVEDLWRNYIRKPWFQILLACRVKIVWSKVCRA